MSRMIDLARNSEAAAAAGGANSAYAVGKGGKGIMYYSDSRTREPLLEVARHRHPPSPAAAAATAADATNATGSGATAAEDAAAADAGAVAPTNRLNRPPHLNSFVDLGDRDRGGARTYARVSARTTSRVSSRASSRASARASARKVFYTFKSNSAGTRGGKDPTHGKHGAPGGSTQENPPEIEQSTQSEQRLHSGDGTPKNNPGTYTPTMESHAYDYAPTIHGWVRHRKLEQPDMHGFYPILGYEEETVECNHILNRWTGKCLFRTKSEDSMNNRPRYFQKWHMKNRQGKGFYFAFKSKRGGARLKHQTKRQMLRQRLQDDEALLHADPNAPHPVSDTLKYVRKAKHRK